MVARQPNVELYTDDDDQEPDNGIVYIYNMFTYMTITYYLLLGLPQFADAPPTPSLAIICIEAPPAPVVAPAPVAAPATPTSLPAPAAPVPAVAPTLHPSLPWPPLALHLLPAQQTGTGLRGLSYKLRL